MLKKEILFGVIPALASALAKRRAHPAERDFSGRRELSSSTRRLCQAQSGRAS
jgi:hypothetical protein